VNLIARVKNAKYDGYRLTYGGLDYLALHTHTKSSTLYSVGNQIGIGKESDIFVVASPSGVQHVLKIHRLGRISFRTVKANRDYLRGRHGGSWMYMSRLAALKEYTFMRALKDNGFRVPVPIAQSRHTVVMELIDAFPLRQITSVPDPAGLYGELLEMILRLASFGLIHGDFNEFNILIREEPLAKEAPGSEKPVLQLIPVLIDFPQMVSVDHPNAEMYFDRDVDCIKRFFSRRFHFTSDAPGPFFKDACKGIGKPGTKRLDVEVEASGFSRKMAKELESYMKEVGVKGDAEVGEGDVARSDDEQDGSNEDEEDERGSEGHQNEVTTIEKLTEASEPSTVSRLKTGVAESDRVLDKFGNYTISDQT
jgi:RIO kinase 2